MLDSPKTRTTAFQVQELLRFEQKRTQKDLAYWVRYAARFGVDHFISPAQSRASLIELHDTDIRIALILVSIMTYLTLKLFIFGS
jgi:hypothetical protein